ncbi:MULTISPECIES: cytochrome P450 [Kitasatospora]|uniref:Putative cytochrome P450 n=1 Tax=Kitasatospora setae (strain ATCC 33774 / DSM 43861 / JCM 3304 / KCC A-0304 / NBRC 14216 / KM-6054) TaxID=452652 RepID=E4N7H2_KITSK|nr:MULTISPECIES: cytochrome P450 [Kitasatospora]BAJ27153.1 putative cytochrome P450 [Kitasatospora setae KM-6054]
MTYEEHGHQGGPVPPPGCPAHRAPGGGGPQDGGLLRLFGPEAEADPAGFYEKLRAEHGEVAPVLLHGDLPAWLVLGYSANLTAMRTPSRFSRDSRRWTEFKRGRVAADSPVLPVIAWQPTCSFVDGEEHRRLRTAVTDGLNRFDRRGMRRYVTRFSDQLIAGFGDGGRADLVSQFAEHLPMLVMTQLLGMPEEYGPRLVEAARDLVRGTATAVASNEYVVESLRRTVQRKRVEPGQDLVSWLLEHPSGLTEEEVLEHLRSVLLAANETTSNLISETLKMVLTDSRFRAHLSGGQMTLPDALDQVLWDSPPFMLVPGRWATGDTELGGRAIRAGDMLLLGVAAGNADPVVRPDLDTPLFGNRSHLAFGSGPHECPGQEIGRAIAESGIDILLTRLPDLQLSVEEDELVWRGNWMSRHLTALPARFTPPGELHPQRPADGADTTVSTPAPATAAPAQTPIPGQRSGTSATVPTTPTTPPPPPVPPTAPALPPQRRGWWGALLARLRG